MPSTPAQKRIRVILADDHELMRSGLASLLRELDFVDVVGEAGDGAEMVRLAEALEPDIVLADVDMPRLDGISAIGQLRQSRPQIRCVVISMSENAHVVRRASAAGAVGYLSKTASAEQLGIALRTVVDRGSYFSPQITARLLAPAEPLPLDVLTERQLEILKMLAQGSAPKEIAFRLNLSAKTVDVHRARIMERLQVADLPALTRYAVRHRLIADD
jgi:DNA-binding NarL/FixJ family response regulator